MDTVGIGIDSFAVYIPPLRFPTTELAKLRGVETDKFIKSVGIYEQRLPDFNQDAAVLAANAARKLIDEYKISDIKSIVVATESGLDASKPVGTNIIGMLEYVYGKGKLSEIMTYETKFACLSGSYELFNAINRIKNEGEVSIVITTDVAMYSNYGKEDKGEGTQGAGAVAFAVKKFPRIIDFKELYEHQLYGVYTANEWDFYKPGDSITPNVDGEYSIECYLNAMASAYNNFKNKYKIMHKDIDGTPLTDHFDYFVFHVPFPNMAERAAIGMFWREMNDRPIREEIEKDIGKRPNKDDFFSVDEYRKRTSEWKNKLIQTKPFKQFWSKVEPSIEVSRLTGNTYTSSLFLGMISVLNTVQDSVVGKRIACGGYGSGAGALAYFGEVTDNYKDAIGGNIFDLLKEGVKISAKEYELLHEWHTQHRRDAVNLPELVQKESGTFCLKQIVKGKREYALVE